MRDIVINMITAYAAKNGMYYPFNELQSKSNQQLLDILLEEHADYICVVIDPAA